MVKADGVKTDGVKTDGVKADDEKRAHRLSCFLHFQRRQNERAAGLSRLQVRRLWKMIHTMKPAFVQPGQNRYRLRVKVGGLRLSVVYDLELDVLVTLFAVEGSTGEGNSGER